MNKQRTPARIALYGAAGKMGREITRLAAEDPKWAIAFACDVDDSPELPDGIDLVIDFSIAAAVAGHLQQAVDRKIPFLTGVTALESDTVAALEQAGGKIPVLAAPNMSPGMNVMMKLTALAAAALPDYKRHLTEIHHTAKVDSPSGTAKKLIEIIRAEAGGDTGVTALRMGDVTGEHRLLFGGPGERLEIVHRADARAVLAGGTLRAAAWLLNRPAGLYTMADVLGI